MPLIALILILNLGLSSCAISPEASSTGHASFSEPMEEAIREVSAYGRVISVNKPQHLIEIKHAPIPELNWAPMLMTFRVVDNVNMTSFEEGNMVNFILELDKNENHRIKDLSLAK